MEKVEKKIKRLQKVLIFFIKNTLLKLFDKLNNFFESKLKKIFIKFKRLTNKKNNILEYKLKHVISSFNKYVISFISLLFIYLFYLTIPSLYDKTWVQNTFEKKLIKQFRINFSVSSDISYEILPSPHFIIKNAKIFNNDLNDPKEFSEIKKLKVFIYQKNFFNKDKLKIKKVLIDEANISLQKGDFNFLDNLAEKKFSNKKLYIRNSNLFYKDDNNKTIFIIQIPKFSLFYDDLKFVNKLNLKGEIFNIPFLLNFDKDLNQKKNTTSISSKKLKIRFENESQKIDKVTKGFNELSILNYRLFSSYKVDNNNFKFKSRDTKLSSNELEYNGKLNFDPFDLAISIHIDDFKIQNLLDTNSFLIQLLKSGQLFQNNINSRISINASNVVDLKILDDLKINFNIINGKINFNSSQIVSNKIGNLTLTNSKLNFQSDDLILSGDFNLSVNKSKNFYSFFQTPKNRRKPISNIFFKVNFDISNRNLKLINLKIDGNEANNEMKNLLNNFNSRQNSKIENVIELKNFVNKILVSYDEG